MPKNQVQFQEGISMPNFEIDNHSYRLDERRKLGVFATLTMKLKPRRVVNPIPHAEQSTRVGLRQTTNARKRHIFQET